MGKYEFTYELSKYSEIFHKFNKYDLYSIPIVLYDFKLISVNQFPENIPSFSDLNDFRVLWI